MPPLMPGRRPRPTRRTIALTAAALLAVAALTTAAPVGALAGRNGGHRSPVSQVWHRLRHHGHDSAQPPTSTTIPAADPTTSGGPGPTVPVTDQPPAPGGPAPTDGSDGSTTASPASEPGVPTTAAPTTAPSGTGPAPTTPLTGVGASRSASAPDTMPAPATSGTPLVKQIRNGAVVATYDSIGAGATGNGPFTRSHAWNHIQPGDVFEVYPAVYEGPGQMPWIGPLPNDDADHAAGVFHRPTNITIRGVTVDGRRPSLHMTTSGDYNVLGHGLVEVDGADGLTWENIDIDGTGGQWVDRAGFFVTDSSDVTLRNVRVHGFQDSQHNGVFGAGGNRGTLHLDNVRLYDNGGWDGPAHNVYVNASTTDPNFTLRVTDSWSSAVNVGHLLKSRAQVTIVEGSVLEGTDPAAGWDCAESFGLDVPNGGRVTVRNSVFVKARPGSCANGMAFRYGAEGMDPGRTHAVTLDHNTFIARSTVWDDAGHRNVPLGFYYPALVPGAAGSPSVPVTVTANRFEGFATADLDAAARYRGTDFVDVPGTVG